MAILKIAGLGNPILRKKTSEVSASERRSEDLARFLDDLVETMRDGMGVGISAPQVYQSIRVIAIENVNNKRYPDKPEFPLELIINPEIAVIGKEIEEDWEGCLSVDLKGMVPRFKKIKYSGLDRKGRAFEKIASGFKARVIQHEVDHINGIVFLERMKNFKTLAKLAEFEKYWKKDRDTSGESNRR